MPSAEQLRLPFDGDEDADADRPPWMTRPQGAGAVWGRWAPPWREEVLRSPLLC